MQIQRMHIEFKIGLDKSDVLNYPNYEPEEIDVFLNKAQENIIKQRCSGNNAKRESIEETQKRRDDLRNITTNSNINTAYTTAQDLLDVVDNKPNGIFVKLPSDYWFALEEEVTVTYTDCNGNTTSKRIDVKPMTHDRYNKVSKDPFNRPCDELVVSLPYEYIEINNENISRVELIGDGSYAIDTYHLRYIREPRTMDFENDISCELSDHIHREIIDEAVNLALENIESRRVQTQTIQLIKNE